jgi:uroporphyrinogen decarboxylase
MTSKERVLRALKWETTDRVPLQIYLTPEMESTLKAYFAPQDFLEALGIDFRHVMPVFPDFKGQRPNRTDVDFYDLWGSGYRRIQHSLRGTYDEAVHLPLADLKTMEDVNQYAWPDPRDVDYSQLVADCDKVKDYAIVLGGAGIPDIVNGVSRGRGMEQVLMDIALRDEVGMAIIDRRVDYWYTVMRRSLEVARGKIDILHLGEDCGTQNGRLFSAPDFEEIFRPRLEKFYDLAHEFGCKAMMHSCGDTHDLLPTFIDMGLDVLDAMQPEPAGMSPETIRAVARGRLAFCGLISTQQTLPFKSEAECRREARHRLDVIARGGGYIFSPAHCIQPDTPLVNVLAIYEEALGKKLIRA